MHLEDLEEELAELRPEDAEDEEDWGLRLVMAMVGKLSEGLMRTDTIADDMQQAMDKTGHSEEEISTAMDTAKEDMIGALFVAVAELAAEQDISIADAVETRVERMKKAREAKDQVQKWKDAGLMNDEGHVDTDLPPENDRSFA